MSLQPFDELFPEIAREVHLVCDVTAPRYGVPLGTYVMRQFYCTEADCDCRRVLIQIFLLNKLTKVNLQKVAASITYGWEHPSYYKLWRRVPGNWRKMSGASLEPISPQGPNAKQFLQVFNDTLDDVLKAKFIYHYAMVKLAVAEGRLPATGYRIGA